MNKAVILIILCISFTTVAIAEIQQVNDAQTSVSQNISYSDCTKMYNINKEKLFYLTMEAININKYTITEIQTGYGYLLFTVNKNKYLATIAEIDKSNSILKITPCNNLYYFRKDILNNIYRHIDLNKDKELK